MELNHLVSVSMLVNDLHLLLLPMNFLIKPRCITVEDMNSESFGMKTTFCSFFISVAFEITGKTSELELCTKNTYEKNSLDRDYVVHVQDAHNVEKYA